MPRLSKREKLLKDNPDFYKQIRARRKTYKRHAGQFTSKSSRDALKVRYSGERGGSEFQYIGYVCMSATGYEFRKFAVPIRRSTRASDDFSPEELARLAHDASVRTNLNGDGSDGTG